MIDENVAHRLRCDCEEVRTIVPLLILIPRQSDIRLMNKGRRLQSMPRVLATHVSARHAMQFRVNERHELIPSGLVSLSPFDEQLGDLRRSHTNPLGINIISPAVYLAREGRRKELFT